MFIQTVALNDVKCFAFHGYYPEEQLTGTEFLVSVAVTFVPAGGDTEDLERTVNYIHRVGLDYVKKKILEDHEGRKKLWEQLQFALDGEPDPWFELKEAAVDTRQFSALPA